MEGPSFRGFDLGFVLQVIPRWDFFSPSDVRARLGRFGHGGAYLRIGGIAGGWKPHGFLFRRFGPLRIRGGFNRVSSLRGH
jgi:hypothetical protein